MKPRRQSERGLQLTFGVTLGRQGEHLVRSDDG